MIFRTQDRPQTARARSVQPWDGAGKELALDLCYYSLAAGASDHPRLGPLGIACESCSGAGTGGHLEARGARLQSTVPYGRPNGRVENKKKKGDWSSRRSRELSCERRCSSLKTVYTSWNN